MSVIKKTQNKKIATKLIGIISLVLVVLTIALTITSTKFTYDLICKVYHGQTTNQMDVISDVINNYYENIEENVNMIATHPDIQKAVAGTITSLKDVPTATFITPSKLGEGVEYDIYKLFEHFASTHPSAKYVYLATQDGGYTQWPEVEMPANYDPTTRGWYQKAVEANGEVIQTDPYQTTEGGMIISNARAVYDESGKLLGVVGIDFEQEFISQLIGQVSIGGDGYFMLTHPNGTVLADAKNRDNLFKVLDELTSQELANNILDIQRENKIHINDTNYISYSDTINEEGWIVTGFTDVDNIKDSMWLTIVILGVVAAILIVASIILVVILLGRIIIPIKKASKYLDVMSDADFSIEIEEEQPSHMTEEVSRILLGISNVKDTLVSITSKINTNSSKINTEIADITTDVEELRNNIQQITSTSQGLAASMEETSAITEQMLITSKNMQKEVESVETSSIKGFEHVNQIRKRAEESMNNVAVVQGRNTEVLNANRESLQAALENAKVVNEIDALTGAIMEITEQTNLLALNAAIEAARAGENGKGFAVVAEEIRKLADQSKTMTLKIQEVISKVTEAVDDLTGRANGLLEFVEKDVAEGYEAIGQIAEAYKNDADDVEIMTTEFKNNAQALNQAVSMIMDSINCVASASTDGATATTEIATAVSQINELTTEVSGKIQDTDSHVKELENSIKAFKF